MFSSQVSAEAQEKVMISSALIQKKLAEENPLVLLQFVSKSERPLYAAEKKAIRKFSFILGEELDENDSLRNQARELFFDSFFDKDWNYKGEQGYIDMRESNLLLHVLPEIGTYCVNRHIDAGVLQKLQNLTARAKTAAQEETLNEFCLIFTGVAAYRLYREYYFNLPLKETVAVIADLNCTLSDVPAFLNLKLEPFEIMQKLSDLVSKVSPKLRLNIPAIFPETSPLFDVRKRVKQEKNEEVAFRRRMM